MKILLSKDCYCLIDDEDYNLIAKYKWHVYDYKKIKYVYSRRNIKMHRLIMGVTDPKIQVDHINGDGLDNRKVNLRICNNQQNSRNSGKRRSAKNTSKYKGVSWVPKIKKYSSRIYIDNKCIRLGYYVNEEDAALAYNKAAKEYFGEFAKVNELNNGEVTGGKT